MLKETNMEEVINVAKTFAMLDPTASKEFPVFVKHPFTKTAFVMLKSKTDNPVGVTNIMEDKDKLYEWQQEVIDMLEKMETPGQIMMQITTSYRLAYLKFIMPYLSVQDYSTCLADAWVTEEAPHSNPNFTKWQLVKLFQEADPKCLMDETEYEYYQKLDDVITVYRGVTPHNEDKVEGLSWTLQQETAEWFAHRFDEEGTVYQAKIEKCHVYACFLRRNEAEIIVNSKYLTDLTELQDISQEKGMTIMQ